MQAHNLSRWFGCGLLVFVAMLVGADSSIAADDKTDGAKTPPAGDAPIADMSAHIEKQLASKGEVAYLDTQLGDIVNDLKLRYRVDISIDKEALMSEGKGEETTFSLMIKDVTLQSALNRLLKQHGLTWTVADEGIVITTKAGEATRTTVNVYDVAGLADEDGNIDYDEISEMLTQSVDPESWRGNGGAAGSIARVSAKKSLVIAQTYTNHRAIAAILKRLAEN